MGMVACIAAVPVETLQRLRSGDESIEEYLYPDDGDSEPPDSIDLDKAWHGIHYLLTGTAEGGDGPEALAILGGEEFGPDVGYGPARFLLPGDVKAVSDALARLTERDCQAQAGAGGPSNGRCLSVPRSDSLRARMSPFWLWACKIPEID
jgi:hypothetical protein